MDSHYWHNCWGERDIGFHQSEANPDLVRFWPNLNLSQNSSVLVPLCGKSLDLVWLVQQGHRVIGLELSQAAVEEFFEKLGVEPEVNTNGRFEIYRTRNLNILCGDFFDATVDDVGTVSAVYDRAALIALPPDMRKCYVSHLQKLAASNVPMLLLTFEYDTSRFDGPPFSVDRSEVARLYGDRYSIEVLDEHPFALPDVEAREFVFGLL